MLRAWWWSCSKNSPEAETSDFIISYSLELRLSTENSSNDHSSTTEEYYKIVSKRLIIWTIQFDKFLCSFQNQIIIILGGNINWEFVIYIGIQGNASCTILHSSRQSFFSVIQLTNQQWTLANVVAGYWMYTDFSVFCLLLYIDWWFCVG